MTTWILEFATLAAVLAAAWAATWLADAMLAPPL